MDYNKQLEMIKSYGGHTSDRSDATVKSFHHTFWYKCHDGVPIYTGRRMHLKSIIGELCWFLKNKLHGGYLDKHNITIWKEWTDENNLVGCIYPRTMLRGVKKCIQMLKEDPYSRRIFFSTYDEDLYNSVSWENRKTLPPCHGLHVQFYVNAYGFLHLHQTQRSADMFLGLPFNITSYALLLHIVALKTGFKPGTLHITTLDTHIYLNHFDSVSKTLKNDKDFEIFPVSIDDVELKELDIHHFNITGYNEEDYPKITAPVSV